MAPPKVRNFKGWINLQPPGPSKVIVTGEVETSSSNELPVLTESSGSKTPNTTLELDLTIRNTGGIGTQAFHYQDARFEAPASKGQYDRVLILWRDEVITSAKIGEAH